MSCVLHFQCYYCNNFFPQKGTNYGKVASIKSLTLSRQEYYLTNILLLNFFSYFKLPICKLKTNGFFMKCTVALFMLIYLLLSLQLESIFYS